MVTTATLNFVGAAGAAGVVLLATFARAAFHKTRDVLLAKRQIQPYLRRTPMHSYPAINELIGATVFIKHENAQPVGAFKVRGGVNLVSQMSDDERTRGVIAASTGGRSIEREILLPAGRRWFAVSCSYPYYATYTVAQPAGEISRTHVRDCDHERAVMTHLAEFCKPTSLATSTHPRRRPGGLAA